jgi:hypothetical protein
MPENTLLKPSTSSQSATSEPLQQMMDEMYNQELVTRVSR